MTEYIVMVITNAVAVHKRACIPLLSSAGFLSWVSCESIDKSEWRVDRLTKQNPITLESIPTLSGKHLGTSSGKLMTLSRNGSHICTTIFCATSSDGWVSQRTSRETESYKWNMSSLWGDVLLATGRYTGTSVHWEEGREEGRRDRRMESMTSSCHLVVRDYN